MARRPRILRYFGYALLLGALAASAFTLYLDLRVTREFEGRRTASGERYDGEELTAAHRTLPFGTRVRVVNLANDRAVEVVINDRGPHKKGRIVDLSHRAAELIGLLRVGVARVRLEVIASPAADRL